MVFSIAVAVFLPLAVNLLVRDYQRDLLARANTTPLIAGAPGSRLDLVLHTLYFRGKPHRILPWRCCRDQRQRPGARHSDTRKTFGPRIPIVAHAHWKVRISQLTSRAGDPAGRMFFEYRNGERQAAAVDRGNIAHGKILCGLASEIQGVQHQIEPAPRRPRDQGSRVCPRQQVALVIAHQEIDRQRRKTATAMLKTMMAVLTLLKRK